MSILNLQPLDVAFLDSYLPGINGFDVTRELRSKPGVNQMIPVMILTSHTQQENVLRARDEGANIVLAKPVASSALYDRLVWASENTWDFVMSEAFNGPDRRHKIEGYPGGIGRRETDKVAVGKQVEPDMSQQEIDALFK